MTQQLRHHDAHRLCESVYANLNANSHFQARGLEVETLGENIILRGTVRSWYQKQIAQESLRSLGFEQRLHNELQVVDALSTR